MKKGGKAKKKQEPAHAAGRGVSANSPVCANDPVRAPFSEAAVETTKAQGSRAQARGGKPRAARGTGAGEDKDIVADTRAPPDAAGSSEK